MSNDAKKIEVLGAIADIRPGYPFRGSIAETADGDAAVVQIKNVDAAAGIDWGSVVRARLEGRRKPDWLDSGDILFTARGNRNAAASIGQVPFRAVAAPSLFLIRLRRRDLAVPEFISWLMNQSEAQRYFSQSATGSYITSIRKDVLARLPLRLPSMETQQLIVRLYQAAVRECQVLEQLIENRKHQLALVANSLMN